MTHQSTIAVLQNRISCICSGYRERQNAPAWRAAVKQGDCFFVCFHIFLPSLLLLSRPKRRTLSSTQLHVAGITAFSELQLSTKTKRFSGCFWHVLISQATEGRVERSPPVLNFSFNCKKFNMRLPERPKYNILYLMEVTGFCLSLQ